MEDLKISNDSSSILIFIDMRTYRNYTDQNAIDAAKEVKSIAGLLKRLGLKPAGGNYAHMKKTIQRLKIDCSHWTGQGWNKDSQLKDWSEYSKVSSMKKHLVSERGLQCECCKLTEWMGKPIKVEVHHIDSDRTNNIKSNLTLICPNCHSYTESYRKPRF